MFKSYRYKIGNSDEQYIILESDIADIPNWYFDTLDKLEPSAEDWINALTEVSTFVEIISRYFELSSIHLQYRYDYSITYTTENVLRSSISLKEWFDKVLKDDKFNPQVEIKLIFNGVIKIEEDVNINCELFNIRVYKSNNIGISLATKNLAFLPNHPIYKRKQYNTWRLNAPRLAKVLEEFTNTTCFDLLTESGEFGKTASISNNIYYLQNGPITGVQDDNWDEFYIPFDLI